MLASYQWLKTLSGVTLSAEEMADTFNRVGIEVESMTRYGEGLDRVVVAEVRGTRPHPEADKLKLVTVFDGESELEVVCGAPNVPEPGRKVIFAKLHATLPGGFVLTPRSIRGVESQGMLCSESELGVGEGGHGIFVFDEDAPYAPGTLVADALSLHDLVFELGITPNRPDALGHVGLARELCLATGSRFELPAIAPAPTGPAPTARVRIEDPERCPRYGAAVLAGVSVGPSPFWLRYALYKLGVRSLGNLVDATNLVMLEWGHPIHGFDLDRLRGGAIVVRRATEGERMPTLDGVERTFTGDDLLICDAERPVAVAGVMGGQESEITDATTNVLIECAYFSPRGVRRTSRRLGLHTDASHRFERGVDPDAVPRVLARALTLMQSLGGGAASADVVDVVAKTTARARITYRAAKADALLGMVVPRDETRAVLERVGCVVVGGSDEALEIEAPSHRPDITREVDLVEEVARIYGYDRIPTRLRAASPSREGTPPRLVFRRALARAAAAAGLHQAMSFAFCSPSDLVNARVSTDAVPLENPLSEAHSVLRTSLLPGLALAAGHARRHGARRVALFELGRTFEPSGGELPVETDVLALFLLGDASGWVGESRSLDFYDLKGVVEAIALDATGGAVRIVLETSPPSRFHPRRAATVFAGDVEIGRVGELHPEVDEAFDLGGRGIYAELSVDALFRARELRGEPRAAALPRFPASSRDVALVVDEAHEAGAVADALLQGGAPLAEHVELFDLYRGEHVPAGKKSLAFRVLYRDPEATLTDAKVEKAHQRACARVIEQFGAQVRVS
jgi:phenylalanyl-tRNA synthetase beta chain